MTSTPFVVTRALSLQSNIPKPNTRRGEVEITLADDNPLDTKVLLAGGLAAGVLHKVVMTKESGADAGTITTTIFDSGDTPVPAAERTIVFQDSASAVPNADGETVFSEELLENDFVTKGEIRGEITIRLEQSTSQAAVYRIQIFGDGKH